MLYTKSLLKRKYGYKEAIKAHNPLNILLIDTIAN